VASATGESESGAVRVDVDRLRDWMNYYGRFYRSKCVRCSAVSMRLSPGRRGSLSGSVGWGDRAERSVPARFLPSSPPVPSPTLDA
jgi:hypothetical protein